MKLKNEVSYSTIIHKLFELKETHFDDKLNVMNQQCLYLYENGYNNGYLAHWAADNAYSAQYDHDNYWILEMHGRSRHIAKVSLQYFFEKELNKMNDMKHLLISVGKGHQSRDNTPVLQDCLIPYLQQKIGIEKIDVNTRPNFLYIDRNDLILYLNNSKNKVSHQ